ncbi:MAG TPA: hypothetical protein VJ874_02175, partial [Candidatus Thermoplasmatota archaeon]|nr:hypothetical protein [Candidatus Thermoplasmatota archaeon]
MRWLVALATVLACLALVGAPVSAEAAPSDPQPVSQHPLAVPWPHVGDAGSYSTSIVRMTDEGASTVERLTIRESFVVEPSGEHYDAEGVSHQVV